MQHKKEENLAEWYSDVIVKSELIEYYDVRWREGFGRDYRMRPPVYLQLRLTFFFNYHLVGVGLLCAPPLGVQHLGAHPRFLRRQDQGAWCQECVLPALRLQGARSLV